jgi:hypothetical protein
VPAPVPVAWLTAFVDLPADGHGHGTAFWSAVTRSAVSPVRGPAGEFTTLLPRDGDAYVRVQRRTEGDPGVHVDLHVDDLAAAADAATSFGATVVHRGGHVVLRSPAGLRFCVVRHRGEHTRPSPVQRADGGRERLDQVCVDVPAPAYDAECRFWAALTGWEHRPSLVPELSFLVRPPALPLRMILQRLGADDGAVEARAHLDIACGPTAADVAAAVAAHEALGAVVVARHDRWTTLRDPAGLRYCCTVRDPVTGTTAA